MIPVVPSSMQRGLLLLGIAFLAACATEQGVPGSRPVEQIPAVVTPPEVLPQTPPAAETPPLVIRPQQPPAGGYPRNLKDSGAGAGVLALAKQAQDSSAAGKYEAAVGQLERALHIEPKNAFIWQALADAHLQLQHADQAESAAQKSTSLAHGNPYLESGNWRLIAAARLLRGDGAGARLAGDRADQISGALSALP